MPTPLYDVVPALESALDWLSLTAPVDSHSAQELMRWTNTQQEREIMKGAQCIEVSPSGYKGRRVGGSFLGVGRYGFLFQFSGILSNDALEICRGLKNDFRCTRTDYRVDTRLKHPVEGLSARMCRAIRGFEKRTEAAHNTAIVHHEDFRRGCSLFVGSRRSGSSFRFYDKGAESGIPELKGVWRAELETKRELSRRTWPQLLETVDIGAMCRSVVSQKMERVGLPVPFVVDCPSYRLATQERVTNDQRRYDWFMSQVLPTIDKIESPKLRQEMKAAFRLRFASRNG